MAKGASSCQNSVEMLRSSRALGRRLLCAGVVLLAIGACKAEEDPDEMVDPDVQGRDTNPDGVPYPTDRLGGKERSTLSPGERIPNYHFRGYPLGDRSRGLQTISMADYYDPQQKRHKVLHLQLAATWCGYCSAEISATVANRDANNARGITYLEVIVAGANADFGPSQAELDGWVSQHASNIDTAVDVRARRLRGIGIDPRVMPHDILVDTRTMEILDSSPGAPLDVGAYGRDGISFVDTHKPSY